MNNYRDFDNYLSEQFEDPENIEAFVNAALQDFQEDNNYEAFLHAIETVIRLKGSITNFSKETEINRTHLYKILNNEVQPQFNTIANILSHLGLSLQVKKVG